MRAVPRNSRSFSPLPLAVTCLSTLTLLAAPVSPSRITRPIDNTRRVTLRGHVHPHARPEYDQGRISPSRELSRITLEFSLSDDQAAALERLLAEQQDPASPNYHHWLTPEEYGERFGVSEADLMRVESWLKSRGLNISAVARGRNWIAVDGAAAQVEAAFQTELHEYAVDGETHFANATEPTLPESLRPVISGIRGLNDFRYKSSRRLPSVQPAYTSSKGSHYLAPGDFATIYNLKPLYDAGIDGSGQKIAVAGQTQINVSDIQQFRSTFNLPANDPQVVLVPGSRDPGISKNDLPEANLDLEWSGAVARKASIVYVYARDVMQAVQYAIDQNLAPVLSISYGSCEAETPTSDALTLRSWARQANAQGMTWFAASGDAGGADCNDARNTGPATDLPSSVPEVTGVGGTEFSEGSGQYWALSNDGNRASALSYVPEMAWNDSASNGSPSASGGGASVYFSTPSWQTGPGVPNDNARHVPDVALSASPDHDGYLVYNSGNLQVFGGTSAAAPAFAGIAALLNHYLVSRGVQAAAGLGNINPNLYALARSTSNIFHDITAGDNIVTVNCASRGPACSASPVGFSAGAGYDQATGLGSVDAFNLATAWVGGGMSVQPTLRYSITVVANPATVATNQTMVLTATVMSTDGSTPAGVVTFSAGTSILGSAALAGSGGRATATLAVSGAQLLPGSATIKAQYSGDPATATSIPVTITQPAIAAAKPVITGLTNGASFRQAFAPGAILSVFGSQLAPSAQSASSVPLPVSMAGVSVTVNGVAAPLYYVSATQLNIQIPYETPANGTAVLSINNDGQVTSQAFQVSSVAPGIFTDQNGMPVPHTTAAAGQIVTLFITGAGAVSPAVSTGTAPPAGQSLVSLPKPVQAVSVTVGGVQAPLQFVGIPPGLVGVLQINYQVPAVLGAGLRPVVVYVGGVPSSAATLAITN